MLVARPARSGRRPLFSDFTNRERRAARLGRPSRRGADRARDVRALLATCRTKETIFNAVFFVVVVSAIVQGTTLEWVAGRLGLLAPAPPVHEAPLEVGPLSKLDLVDFAVAGDHAVNGSAVRELGLPRDALIAVINRGERDDPAARQHRRRGRRPALRPRPAHDARRPRGRLLALAAERV